jgi:hypothetical protein
MQASDIEALGGDRVRSPNAKDASGKLSCHTTCDDETYSVCTVIQGDDGGRERIPCDFIYPVGTRVRKYFEGYGWASGQVALFEGVYRVRYEDGDEEDFVNSDPELNEIALHARRNSGFEGMTLSPVDKILPMETPVYKNFPGYGWFAGIITAFDGVYLVRYDDGDEEELFYDCPELQAITAEADDTSTRRRNDEPCWESRGLL